MIFSCLIGGLGWNSEHTEKFVLRISGVPEMQSISEDAQKPPEYH